MRALLESEGFDVVGEAADGDGAIREAVTLRPGRVLLDIQLPGRDGFVVAEELASVSSIPAVILISSRDADSYGGRLCSGSSPASPREAIERLLE